MYIPAGPATLLAVSNKAQSAVTAIEPNRRSNMFAVLRSDSFEIWNVRPCCKLAQCDRSPSSLSKYGQNIRLIWTPNGLNLVVVTSTSHIFNYSLRARDEPVEQSTAERTSPSPTSISTSQLNPPLPPEHIATFPPAAGEGYVIPYAPETYSRVTHNLDAALDDVAGGHEGFTPDGLFRYRISSVGFGLDLSFQGIARVDKGTKIVSQGANFLETPSGSGIDLLVLLDQKDSVTIEHSKDAKQTESSPRLQQLVSVPYPFNPDHLVLEDLETPLNSPTKARRPVETTTSPTETCRSARFGGKYFDAVSELKEDNKEKAPTGRWIALDEDVEANVHVTKWNVNGDSRSHGFHKLESNETIVSFQGTRSHSVFIAGTNKQHVYIARYHRASLNPRKSLNFGIEAIESSDWEFTRLWTNIDPHCHVTSIDLNIRFGLCAIGLDNGKVCVVDVLSGSKQPQIDWAISPSDAGEDGPTAEVGTVRSVAWSKDGYALAVGWKHVVGLWNVVGRRTFLSCDKTDTDASKAHHVFEEHEPATSRSGQHDFYERGVDSMVWTFGNNELLVMSSGVESDSQVEAAIISTMRSATTCQPNPLQPSICLTLSDHSVRIYRGKDRRAEIVLDPESDLFDHVTLPPLYVAIQWPIRFASMSNDGILLAVAGRHGLAHYSTATGRWKLFLDEVEEQSFTVKGGMVWYWHVLIAGVESKNGHELRMYSRDNDLALDKCLDRQFLPHSIVTITLQGPLLFVLTEDNTLYHYNITTSRDAISLVLRDSMSLQGIIHGTSKVRSLCCLAPQKDDFNLLETVIVILAGYSLVALEPQKSAHGGIRYEARVLHKGIETFWLYDGPVSCLQSSIWAVSRTGLLIWPNLTREPVQIPTEGSPQALLHEKGLIVSLSSVPETRKQVPSQNFRTEINTTLYLPHLLFHFLQNDEIDFALGLAHALSHLPYFAHSFEVLLQKCMDVGAEHVDRHLTQAACLLDHFDQALEVAVAALRKTDIEHWPVLFRALGSAQTLFERCLSVQPPQLHTASRLLIAIRNQDGVEFDIQGETNRLLQMTLQAQNMPLCKEIVTLLHSIDPTGKLIETTFKSIQPSS